MTDLQVSISPGTMYGPCQDGKDGLISFVREEENGKSIRLQTWDAKS